MSNKHSPTNKAIPGLKRRDFLRYAGVAGIAVGSAPAIVSQALSQSGELNVLLWSDYLPPTFLDAFTKGTGIKVNYTGIGSNEEIINKMKATKGEGFDLCSPTNLRALQWENLGLLQPFDLKRVDTGTVNPPMVKIGEQAWNFGGKGVFWLPHIWGTEGMAWRTDIWNPPGGTPSYGDIWRPEVKGKTMGRPHSMMLGTGLYLETIGILKPGDIWSSYSTEDKMREVWTKITKFCVDNKDQIKLFWNDADSQKNGLLNDGVVVGQTWDGPPLSLKKAGEPVQYQAPKEGSMAWVDGLALSVAAKNVDQVYEFIKYCYKPDLAGEAINHHGYNSPVLGADAYADDKYKQLFNEAYPGDSLANLNPWPPEPQWYADIRTEFRNQFVNA